MTVEAVLNIASDALWTIIITAAPLLLLSMVVGLIISIFQTVTSIQEQTLTFVPKIVTIFIGLLIFGSALWSDFGVALESISSVSNYLFPIWIRNIYFNNGEDYFIHVCCSFFWTDQYTAENKTWFCVDSVFSCLYGFAGTDSYLFK